jgi:hypothetical protein
MLIERIDYGLTYDECVELNKTNARHRGFTPYAVQKYTRVSRATVSIDGQLMLVERITSDLEWETTPGANRWRMIQDQLLQPLFAKIRNDAYDGFEKYLKFLGVDTK